MVQFGETAGDSVCRCTLPVRVENRMPTRDEGDRAVEPRAPGGTSMTVTASMSAEPSRQQVSPVCFVGARQDPDATGEAARASGAHSLAKGVATEQQNRWSEHRNSEPGTVSTSGRLRGWL